MDTDPKPAISRKAILALVVPVAQWIVGSLCFVQSMYRSHNDTNMFPEGILLLWSLPVVGFFLSMFAWRQIEQSNGKLYGYRFVIEGLILTIALSIFSFAFTIYACDHMLLFTLD